MDEISPVPIDSEQLQNFRRVFEDNERVWFHPQKGLLAVWYGGATVNIYRGDTYEEVDMFTQSLAFRDDASDSEVETAIGVRLAERGFVRKSRSSDSQTPKISIAER